MREDGPLTTGQAAEYCHVSPATIVNWITDGRLEAYTTPGGHRRIPRPELVSFLETNGMPVHPSLQGLIGPRLLLVGESPRVQTIARTLGEGNGSDVSVAQSVFEASAEVVQSGPDAVIIDMEASPDPLGLCRWISASSEETAVVVIGAAEQETPALAAGADLYVADDGVSDLETRIAMLLERHDGGFDWAHQLRYRAGGRRSSGS